MAIELNFPKEASKNLITGVKRVYDIIKYTIGPMGNDVIISPTIKITRNGLTIAKAIKLENKFENIGATVATKLAEEVNDIANDGTKTAIILLANFLFAVEKILNRGYSAQNLINGFENIQSMFDDYFQNIPKQSLDDEIIQSVAISASNNYEIGRLISTLHKSDNLDNNFPINFPFIINRGYLSYHMADNAYRKVITLQDVNVILINDNKDLSQLLNKIESPILIIFNKYEQNDLSLINKFLSISNKEVVAISLEDRKKIYELASYCHFQNINGHLIGNAEEIKVTPKQTFLFNKKIKKSFNNLFNSIEHLHLINKAIQAVNNAKDSGVILGEGMGLINLRTYLQNLNLSSENDDIARKIIVNSLEVPYQLIINNACLSHRSLMPYDFNTKSFVSIDEFTIYDSLFTIKTLLNKVINYLPIFIKPNILIISG